jgi:ribosomal-protein-alanine N-acetyltransferase
VPLLITPALPAGSLRGDGQPTLPAAGGLTLRPWRPADVPVVREAFDCPAIQRWHVRRMAGDGEARAWIDGWAGRWAAESDGSWAVADRHDRVAGQVGLRTVNLFESDAQLSYWVLPAARGAGVAGRAVDALTRWAFGTVGFNRLTLQHATGNHASCRVAAKAGFRLEGELRRAMLHADGWHDVHLHALLRPTGPPGARAARADRAVTG